MGNGQAELHWKNDVVPVSTRFDDPYFSLENGLKESRHVFLDGNDLPARFFPGFQIAELGFGTGLNLLAAWAAWEESGQSGALAFTSFEAFPMLPDDMHRALAVFPDLAPWRDRFLSAWTGTGQVELASLKMTMIAGDARVTLPAWEGTADAWFLDGFSPAKNPELWEEPLLDAMAQHTRSGGTASTYSAAGSVRRGLEKAGFEVSRIPGFGRKRHMTRARRK